MRKFILLFGILLIPYFVTAQWIQLGQTLEGLHLEGTQTPDKFGSGVAVSSDGTVMAVGTAPILSLFARSYVQVFRLTDGQWVQIGDNILGAYNPNDSSIKSQAGKSISLSSDGNILVVGEPYWSDVIEDEIHYGGRVRVFQNVNDEWLQVGEDIIDAESTFGSAVDISNDGQIIIVGDPNTSAVASGKVIVYKNIDNNWIQLGDIIEGGGNISLMGFDVSLSGDGNRFAASFAKMESSGDIPYSRIYEYNEGAWNLIGEIQAAVSPLLFYYISISLSDDGNRLAIGLPNEFTYSGKVGIYQFVENNNWESIGSITGSAVFEAFGFAVGLSQDGNVLVVGSGYGSSGKIYQWNGNEWVQSGTDLVIGQLIYGRVAASGDGNVAVFGLPNVGSDGTVFAFQNCEVSNISVLVENDSPICSGNSVNLVASITPSYYEAGGTVKWYLSQNGTEPFFTGTEYETPVLTETTSYWVEAVTASGCVSERTEIVVTVNPTPELTVENTEIDICEGTSVTLIATSDGTISWYGSAEATEPVFTGSEFTTPELTETTSYWVGAQSEAGCTSERIEIIVNVLPAPELEIENTEVEVCLGSDAYLYAFSEGNVIFWYAEEDDTEYLYHGNNFIVEGLTETTTFWVEAYNLNTGCVSERIPVTVTVTPVADISAEETEFEICAGNTATLTATSDSAVNWYDTADGTEPIFSGEEFTTPILNSTTHYWAEASGEGECVSGRIEFTVNVNASPDAPEAQPIQAYVEGMILADFEVEHTGTLHWYADEELTVELPDTTPVVIHTTYYVTQSLGDCESEATEIMADNFLNTGNPVKDEFAYYPNPVQDRLNFKGNSKVEHVQIFDMSGRLMMDQTNRNSGIEQLDVSSLPKGSYVVKAQTERGMKTFKIIKN